MKDKATKLKRLHDARRRLRDVAAGEHAAADEARAHAVAGQRDAEHHLDQKLDGAMTHLATTRDVRGLLRFLDGVRAAKAHVAEATSAAAAAGQVADTRVAALRVRARELKVAELLLDRQRDHLARAEQRREQTLTDERAVRVES